MSEPVDPECADVRATDATFASLERHANRIVVAGALVSVNLLLLEAARGFTGSALHAVLACGLVAAMYGLLWRLASRVVRFTVRSARQQSATSRTLLASVEQFANGSAGKRGTVEALCSSAADARCEVLIWNSSQRELWAPATGDRTPLTAAMARRMEDAMSRRKPLLLTDVRVSGTLPTELAARCGTAAMVVAPMWSADELVGLVLRRYGSARTMLRAQEVALVSGLAALGAVALGKALVVDREQQRARDNELLLRSVELAGSGNQHDHLADYALQAAEALQSSRSAIYALAGGQLRLVGSVGVAREIALSAPGIPSRSELGARVAEARSGAVVLDVTAVDDHVEWTGPLRVLGFGRHAVVQGVHDADGLVGAVVVDGSEAELGSREHQLMTALARQVALSLERRRMQYAMRKRSRHLACTPKLARSLTGQRDPEAVGRIAARELNEGFGFGRVSVALVPHGTSHPARIVASAGVLAQSPEPVVTTRVIEAVMASCRPYVSCAATGEAAARTDDPNAPASCRSQLAVPIIGPDQVCVGVISVYERDPDALGEDDLHMLETVADQLAGTLEQAELFERLERSYFKTVEALAAALEAKDAYTLDHARSITDTSAEVGRRLGMRGDEIRDLRLGALLHDIGKIGVPGEILNKPGPLDDAEFEVMKEHTVIGEQIIAPIEFLDGVRPLVLHEHERWDGAGYPHGLRGEDIPLGARIIFVCDAWHAMTSDRPYRRSLPIAEARRRLLGGTGSQFDPQVVEAFLEVLDEHDGRMVVDEPAEVAALPMA